MLNPTDKKFWLDENARSAVVEVLKKIVKRMEESEGGKPVRKGDIIANLIGRPGAYSHSSNFESLTAGSQHYRAAFETIQQDYPEYADGLRDEIAEIARSMPSTKTRKSNAKFQFAGPKTEAIRKIHDLRSDIVELRNTHIVSSDQVYYDDEENQLFREIFTTVLDENSGSLIDVFGGEEGSAALNDHYATAALLDDRPRYFKKVLPLKPPMLPFLNFMLIRLSNHTRIVFYGWGGVGNDSVGDVVGTDDPGATAIFHNIHINLFDLAANSK